MFRSNVGKYFSADEESDFRNFIRNFADTYFVIEHNEVVVGAGGYALNPGKDRSISLCWGMIRSDHHGQGFGGSLTKHRIDAAREIHGDLPVRIETSQHTSAFYEKFGFKTDQTDKDFFAKGIDRYIMRLD